MNRRQLLAVAGSAVATSIAGCSGGSSSGNDPTETDDGTDSDWDSNGATRTEVEGGPDLPDPSLSVGDFTCSEDMNPIEITLEGGELVFDGLAFWENLGGCTGIKPDVRWGDDGELEAELHVTDEQATEDCIECDGPSMRHREFTYSISAPDGDYWSGDVLIRTVNDNSLNSLAVESFDQ